MLKKIQLADAKDNNPVEIHIMQGVIYIYKNHRLITRFRYGPGTIKDLITGLEENKTWKDTKVRINEEDANSSDN